MDELKFWEDVIKLPIIADRTKKWSPSMLERVLTDYIIRCSVECFILNNDTLCTTLSGGLDSSFCLAKLRKAVGPNNEIHSFTIGTNEDHLDIKFARMVSQEFDTIHHEIIPSKKEIHEAQEEILRLWEDEVLWPGDVAVFLTYKSIAQNGFKAVIAHDGIDELLGGYWEHRRYDEDKRKKKEVFEDFWSRIESEHLLPLEKKARHFGVKVILPYLQAGIVKYISKIPLNSRSNFIESKIPLRLIAKNYLPDEIIRRSKKGFCGALER